MHIYFMSRTTFTHSIHACGFMNVFKQVMVNEIVDSSKEALKMEMI